MKTSPLRLCIVLLCIANLSHAEDQVAAGQPDDKPAAPAALIESVEIDGGKYRFTVETTEAPDLTDWAHRELIPVLQKCRTIAGGTPILPPTRKSVPSAPIGMMSMA